MCPPGSQRSLEVLDAGALTTVQDAGRPGWAHLGVPRSGALDQPAYALANRLVGNPAGAAVLETTLSGVLVRLDAPATIAVTGARGEVRVDGRAVEHGAAVTVPAGLVEVGPATDGLRSYLAVNGGIVVEPVLGSRSTDLLSGLGPAPLQAGEVLPLGDATGEPAGVEAVPLRRTSTLRLRLGPRDDWFREAGTRLDGASYTVSAESNRVGLRLQGDPLERVVDGELPSEGMVLGAVQVPPSGQPVVFLHDHPVTGGYPVVGVVHRDDLAACAQARPGDVLTLRVERAAAR